ncbi:hypothetical protein GN330_16480 [Nitratireductor sp. CAU 1489]|uniref:Uncharacterized protein n=1 Tax=Nitratireductor arenosus TaxID=2682096 RepID=A0A844QHS6_9HYPH|nr:hypothetical protein [Nitratireductor arenosus]MVA98845.1 hypothetical protein [Nitratireductor arenosus]
MPWARFTKTFDFDFRPERAVCIEIRPSHTPQEFPGRVIDAAVKAGAAERVESPKPEQKRAYKRAKRAG